MKRFRENIATFMIVIAAIGSLTIFAYQHLQAQNHIVTLEAALRYVHNFRNNPTVPNFQSLLFDRSAFDQLLRQSGCSSIRFYYAKKDNGEQTLVAVGVDANGNDMESGVIAEETKPCPPWCSNTGQLSK